MDGDLEDGEISGSGSDTEMGTAQVPAAFSGQSFHNRAAVQPSAASYRSGNKPVSSDSDQDSSDEDSEFGANKRPKASNATQPPPESTTTRPEPTRMDVPNAPGAEK
ncbi:Bifunctional autolysin [Dissostichus eleginoides]|uniref:Bifunctional autolysin n=1 Tax=Dissostichus eleginoides TaxID=100907 RepID=A0AAD9FHX7_DISEL|nr:Bifunctional autolysin [Dissostichus eleginoides]